MSFSALRQSPSNAGPNQRRSFGAGKGAEGNARHDEAPRRDDRPEGKTAAAGKTVALEPHWDATIESATD